MTAGHFSRLEGNFAMTLLHRLLFGTPAARAEADAEGASAVTRSRAVDADEKEARRVAILDAAARLFDASGELSNVADIAHAAGLAKGTVYLYFPTKEAVYLALHQRQLDAFFVELCERLSAPGSFSVSDMAEMARAHFLRDRGYMPLCAFCMGFAADAVPESVWCEFHDGLGRHLMTAGAGIERRWPHLAPGEGLRLLKHSYALMVGLFHLIGEHSGHGHRAKTARPALTGIGSYEDEALIALFRYWTAVVGADATPLPMRDQLSWSS